MYEDTPEKRKATRAFLTFGIAFFAVSISFGFWLGYQNGAGMGPWDSGRTWSCYSPGGPYYLADRPISEQPCPSATSMDMRHRMPQRVSVEGGGTGHRGGARP